MIFMEFMESNTCKLEGSLPLVRLEISCKAHVGWSTTICQQTRHAGSGPVCPLHPVSSYFRLAVSKGRSHRSAAPLIIGGTSKGPQKLPRPLCPRYISMLAVDGWPTSEAASQPVSSPVDSPGQRAAPQWPRRCIYWAITDPAQCLGHLMLDEARGCHVARDCPNTCETVPRGASGAALVQMGHVPTNRNR